MWDCICTFQRLAFSGMDIYWRVLFIGIAENLNFLHLSFSESGFYGAIVREDSGINDYKTLLVNILTCSDEWSDKNTALDYLVEQGYQQRRRYSGIEAVMKQARLLKEKIQ